MKPKNNFILKKYYEKIWNENKYDHSKLVGNIDIRKLFDKERKNRALRYLKPNKDDTILDAGCGNGNFTLRVSKKCKKIYGIDITNEAFKKTKQKAPSNLIFREMNLENLKFKDKFFDKVICIEALEHVLDPKKVLKEFYRVLKPKGKSN